MATRMMASRMSTLGELRFEPTAKRVRAMIGGTPIVDSTRAVLVWEPRRIVPSYAVPIEDVHADLQPSEGASGADSAELGFRHPDVAGPPVLPPNIPFSVHTTEGEALDVSVGGQTRAAAAFRIADPELDGYAILDFAGLDEWYEEDELIVSHPRDPFSRIDMRRSSRHVQIEDDGITLADSRRPLIVFETGLPMRYYLPRDDVRVALSPTATRTICAYKGEASHLSVEVGDRVIEDLAWTYQAPLRDAADLRDLICFYDEKVDLVVDGLRRERPVTPWS